MKLFNKPKNEFSEVAVRPMLATYYSANPLECKKEIEFSYNHNKFGPLSNKSIQDFKSSQMFNKIANYSNIAFINPHGAYCDGGPVMAHPFAILKLLAQKIGLPTTILFIGNSH